VQFVRVRFVKEIYESANIVFYQLRRCSLGRNKDRICGSSRSMRAPTAIVCTATSRDYPQVIPGIHSSFDKNERRHNQRPQRRWPTIIADSRSSGDARNVA
jgi:hypothetical protein